MEKSELILSREEAPSWWMNSKVFWRFSPKQQIHFKVDLSHYQSDVCIKRINQDEVSRFYKINRSFSQRNPCIFRLLAKRGDHYTRYKVFYALAQKHFALEQQRFSWLVVCWTDSWRITKNCLGDCPPVLQKYDLRGNGALTGTSELQLQLWVTI